jgi:hypothetical protein
MQREGGKTAQCGASKAAVDKVGSDLAQKFIQTKEHVENLSLPENELKGEAAQFRQSQ